MDAQHENLMHYVAATVLASSRDMQLLCAKRLYEIAQEHFAYEEALMKNIRSPSILEHGAQHKVLLSRLDATIHAITEKRLERPDIGRNVSEWLLTHMTTLDSELTEEIRLFESRDC